MKARSIITTVMVCLALSVLVAEASAAPAALASCRTISMPGSYVLGRDITLPATSKTDNCFRIEADNVTIDFNGFTVTGKGGTGIGVDGNNHSNIVVKNGTITNFSGGVILYDSSTIQNMRFTNNVWAVAFASGSCIVKDSVFWLNGSAIALLDGQATGNLVVNNTYGINASYRGATVANNSVLNNTNLGVEVPCPALIYNNTIVGNSPNLTMNGAGCVTSNNVAP